MTRTNEARFERLSESAKAAIAAWRAAYEPTDEERAASKDAQQAILETVTTPAQLARLRDLRTAREAIAWGTDAFWAADKAVKDADYAVTRDLMNAQGWGYAPTYAEHRALAAKAAETHGYSFVYGVYPFPSDEWHRLEVNYASALAELYGADVADDGTAIRRKSRAKVDPVVKAERKAKRSERDDEIVKLRDNGLSWGKLAAKVGLSITRVRKIYAAATTAA